MEEQLRQTKKILAVYIEDKVQLETIMKIIACDLEMMYAKGRLDGSTQMFN